MHGTPIRITDRRVATVGRLLNLVRLKLQLHTDASERDLVSGLAVVKGACVAAVGRGWVRAGRSHSSLMARWHHRSKGITLFFVVTSP